jgi:hypothetical protein
MQSWISEMCQHVKSVAPNHLVGIGYEGFYGPDSGHSELNPADWAAKEVRHAERVRARLAPHATPLLQAAAPTGVVPSVAAAPRAAA